MSEPKCGFDPCDRPVMTKGLCNGHYQQRWKGLALTPLTPRLAAQGTCAVDDCSRSIAARGLCSRHAATSARMRVNPEEMPALYRSGCMNPNCPETQDLHVDHDHSCCPGNESCGNCVRGALCRTCNILLGWVERAGDSRSILSGLEKYITSPPDTGLTTYRPAYKTKKRRGVD